MYSTNNNNSSIGHVLVQVGEQLIIPTVSIGKKFHSFPKANQLSSIRTINTQLSLLSISHSKHSDINKRKIVRDELTQMSSKPTTTQKIDYYSNHFDNNIKSTMSTYYKCPISSNCSPKKRNKSIKTTLGGIWQGLNNNRLRSSSTTSFNSECIEERIKKNSPNWKAFSKVVTSLLTFTRTKIGKYQWIQLVGHPETFKEGIHSGFILKQLCEYERDCCQLLENDILKDFVPKYNGVVQDDQEKNFIEMEDLLSSFHEPCIMDCKMGVRTYLEEELDKSERDPEPRADLYNKMIAIDPFEPTEKENEEKKIIKPRYMTWRESLSSSQDLGFRIEAIKKSRGLTSKEFQRIKQRQDIKNQINEFIGNSLSIATQYLQRLIDLRSTCVRSKFFQTHELIGSSLLFVHDKTKASVWMIDFGKTRFLPDGIFITHRKPWIRGSHEDGYLFGLDNFIEILQEIVDNLEFNLKLFS